MSPLRKFNGEYAGFMAAVMMLNITFILHLLSAVNNYQNSNHKIEGRFAHRVIWFPVNFAIRPFTSSIIPHDK
jgi:hypothetical protein